MDDIQITPMGQQIGYGIDKRVAKAYLCEVKMWGMNINGHRLEQNQ